MKSLDIFYDQRRKNSPEAQYWYEQSRWEYVPAIFDHPLSLNAVFASSLWSKNDFSENEFATSE